jgi:hypothetical protein
MVLRTTKELINIAGNAFEQREKSRDLLCGGFNCRAFTSPAIKVTDRVIYVNGDEFSNNYAVLCHEMCQPGHAPTG